MCFEYGLMFSVLLKYLQFTLLGEHDYSEESQREEEN